MAAKPGVAEGIEPSSRRAVRILIAGVRLVHFAVRHVEHPSGGAPDARRGTAGHKPSIVRHGALIGTRSRRLRIGADDFTRLRIYPDNLLLSSLSLAAGPQESVGRQAEVAF